MAGLLERLVRDVSPQAANRLRSGSQPRANRVCNPRTFGAATNARHDLLHDAPHVSWPCGPGLRDHLVDEGVEFVVASGWGR